MSIFSSYRFTKKTHPPVGIMSFILGIISLLGIVLTIYIPYIRRSEISLSAGLTCLLGLLMAATGLILGIICIYKKDIYSLFPTFGIGINALVIAICGYILYLGVYGA